MLDEGKTPVRCQLSIAPSMDRVHNKLGLCGTDASSGGGGLLL